MELTPERQRRIEAHLADSKRQMLDVAFELNDLVRFAVSAARERPGKVYYPMDPVSDTARQWTELNRKLARLAAQVADTQRRLGVPPFDAEAPAADDPPLRVPSDEHNRRPA